MASEPPRWTPSALSSHLGCAHVTVLDRALAAGRIERPSGHDPDRWVLEARGRAHEAAYVEHLRAQGLRIALLRGQHDVARTLAAMREGTDAIVQAPLGSGRWYGEADVLRRVDRESTLGPWAYEAIDTKLARHTRAGAIVQLGLYSSWLAELQGVLPERMWIVAPGEPFRSESHRPAEVLAYVRHAQRRLEAAWAEDADLELQRSYPEPCEHCEVCRWWKDCDARRRDDDHLSLVAGIARTQIGELREVGIHRLDALARGREQIPARPRVGGREGYLRMHEQARLQLRGRDERRVLHELLAIDPAEGGLAELPTPTAHDLFLDLEGDAFVGTAGLEYLFGLSTTGDAYCGRWALDPAGERVAFEQTIDAITAALAIEPELHVYHFGVYEPAALRRMVGRHATRIEAVDRMLRGGVLVDLHRIVRRSLIASVERYSLKELEPLFGFVRAIELADARAGLRTIEAALELGDSRAVPADAHAIVEGYNRDDCVATRALRDWLETLRAALERERGGALPRPMAKSPDAPEDLAEQDARVARAVARLHAGVPAHPELRSADERARWLLGNLLGFHRREQKAATWEKYRLLALGEEDREDEREGIGGLVHVRSDAVGAKLRHHYRFGAQETAVARGDRLTAEDGKSFGVVESIDRAHGERPTVLLTTKSWSGRAHPRWVFVHELFPIEPKPEALLRFAEAWLDGRLGSACALALLERNPPALSGTTLARRAGESSQAQACRVVLALDRSVLAIQGPPGTGKTHTGAEMIVRLVEAGRRVGVTAMSHAVIRNLLDKVRDAARELDVTLRIGAKVSDTAADATIRETEDNAVARRWLAAREVEVLGGTPWLWAREDFAAAVDVLFVDEAGQLALADALAVAGAADSLVLLGDPQQLTQPRKAAHPDGADISALGHVIGDAPVIDPSRGLFLDVTWRLPPAIRALTSELFYAGELRGLPELERRALFEAGDFDGAGCFIVPVEHARCGVRSDAEVDAIDRIVAGLLAGARWRDKEGIVQPLVPDDVLVIAPYNAQVAALAERLAARGVQRVGTVDRFQGQQAPVVIWSTTSSSAEDAPRGTAFLFDGHRFNVATSRAKVACIVVGSPRLFEAECRTPEHVRMVNRWCALAEHARHVRSASLARR